MLIERFSSTGEAPIPDGGTAGTTYPSCEPSRRSTVVDRPDEARYHRTRDRHALRVATGDWIRTDHSRPWSRDDYWRAPRISHGPTGRPLVEWAIAFIAEHANATGLTDHSLVANAVTRPWHAAGAKRLSEATLIAYAGVRTVVALADKE